MFYLLLLSCNVVDCSSVNSGVIPKLSSFFVLSSELQPAWSRRLIFFIAFYQAMLQYSKFIVSTSCSYKLIFTTPQGERLQYSSINISKP